LRDAADSHVNRERRSEASRQESEARGLAVGAQRAGVEAARDPSSGSRLPSSCPGSLPRCSRRNRLDVRQAGASTAYDRRAFART
jgi:hypothetical protein